MYKIIAITNKEYIEPTYVCLYSFFKYNDLEVDLYSTSKLPNKFNFKNLNIHYVEYPEIPDIKTDLNCLKEVTLRIKLFDEIKSDYILSFDTDSYFKGSIEDLLKDYKENFIGCKDKINQFYPHINCGFMILNKNNYNLLYNKYKEFLYKNNSILEQSFLNYYFRKSKLILDPKYNLRVGKTISENPIFVHFATKLKPFKNTQKDIFNFIEFKHSKYYYEYYDLVNYLNVTEEFKRKCNEVLPTINKLKELENKFYGKDN